MLKFAACPRNIGALPGKTPRVPAAGTHCRARQRWRRPVKNSLFWRALLGVFPKTGNFLPSARKVDIMLRFFPLCRCAQLEVIHSFHKFVHRHIWENPRFFKGSSGSQWKSFPGFSTPVQNPPVKHNLLPARPAFSSWFPAARPAVSPTAWPRGYPDLRPRIQSTGWRQPGPAVKR